MLDANGKERLFAVTFVAWTDAWEECVSLVESNLTLAQAATRAAKWIKDKGTPWTFEGFGLNLPHVGRIVSVSVEIEEQGILPREGSTNG